MKIIATAFFGVTFGFLIGISFPSLSITKVAESILIVLFLCLIRFVSLSSLEDFCSHISGESPYKLSSFKRSLIYRGKGFENCNSRKS